MNILETKNLSYSYDNQANALFDVSIAIKKGEITAILGGNGAGKSTLFLNLNGVFTPKEGAVFFAGKQVEYTGAGIRELRRRVGIVFQDPNDQLFSASVRNDIGFGALNLGLPEDQVKLLVEQVAAQIGIGDLLDKPTHTLSFGQKKRVAIAGVLVMNPDVIILDEPTAGLDPLGVSELLNLLLQIKQNTGVSVVISTHDIDIIPLYCGYTYVLDGGKVVLEGTPKEIFAQAEILRRYSLRIPRIAHLMEILHNKDGVEVDIGAATISEARAAIKKLL